MKVVLAMIIVLLASFFALFLIQRSWISDRFADLERKEATRQLNEIEQMLYAEGRELHRYVLKALVYELDTHDGEITEQLLQQHRVEAVMMFDYVGRLQFVTSNQERLTLVPNSLGAIIQAVKEQETYIREQLKQKQYGFVAIGQEAYFYASQPIYEGERYAGMYVAVRWLDNNVQREIEEMTNLRFTVEHFDRLLPSLQQAVRRADYFSATEEQLLSYRTVDDIGNVPLLVLKLTRERTIYQQAKESQSSLLVMYALFGVGVIASTLYLLEKLVIGRLLRLHRQSGEIAGGGREQFIVGRTNDELDQVIAHLNAMLVALKRTKEEAEQKNRQIAKIAEHVTDLIIHINADFEMSYISPDVTEQLGIQPELLLGQQYRRLLLQSEMEKLERMFRRVAAGEKVSGEEIYVSHRDGRWLYFEVSASRIADDGLSGMILTARDVTLKRQLLEQLVATKEAAEQANRAKSDFLSQMTHELRTPLNAIIGYIQLMQLTEYDADEQEYLREMNQASRHLLYLINDILDYAKAEKGMLVLQYSEVDIVSIVEECIAWLEVEAVRKQVKVVRHYPSALLLQLDGKRFRQIVLNLLSNAIKYNKVGGTVDLKLEQGEQLVLVVKDTGIGLSQEDVERLFQPFIRVGDRKEFVEGTGLGLVVCKEIVKAMRGEIYVDSELHVGTTFTVIIALGGEEDES